MRLTGALSNHDVSACLEGIVGRKRRILRGAQGAEPRPSPRLRLPMGAIQAATLRVLRDAEDALAPSEVRECVEERLRRPISQDTISSFLSVASRSADIPVQRVGRGRYRIAE